MTSQKKKALSDADKSVLFHVHQLLQWKGLTASAKRLAEEANLDLSVRKQSSALGKAAWGHLVSRQHQDTDSNSDSSSESEESEPESDSEEVSVSASESKSSDRSDSESSSSESESEGSGVFY